MATLTFSVDTLAVLMLALKENGSKGLANVYYEMMSSLDGTKTAESFKHQMRPVIARANELKARKDGGEAFQGVKTGTKRAKTEDDGDSPDPKQKKQRTPRKPKGANPQTPNGSGKKKAKANATVEEPSAANGGASRISMDFEDGEGNVLKSEKFEEDDDLY